MNEIKYVRLNEVGYCFDPEQNQVRMRMNGSETIIKPGTEEMGQALYAVVGEKDSNGVEVKGEMISREEYLSL